MKKINWRALGTVLWHGATIAIDAAEILQQSGALKLSGKAGTAFWVAAAIEHAAQGQRVNLASTLGSTGSGATQ